jgi:hypothetical protein
MAVASVTFPPIMTVRFLMASVLVAALVAAPAHAHAQSALDTERAERLFREATVLVDKGAYAEACPRLEESQRLDPALGTQFNLALCYERIGRLGSAYRNLRAVERLARASGKSGRAEIAASRLQELRGRTPHLVIEVHDVDASVKVDGDIVDPGDLRFYAVDPGDHQITVTAPAKEPWQTRVRASMPTGEAGGEIAIDVPALARPIGPARVVTIREQGQDARRTIGFVLGGVGVVATAIGAVTGVIILDAKSTANEKCAPGCIDEEGRDAVTRGETLLPINAIALGVGVAALAAGALLVFTSAKKPGATPSIVGSSHARLGQGGLVGVF